MVQADSPRQILARDVQPISQTVGMANTVTSRPIDKAKNDKWTMTRLPLLAVESIEDKRRRQRATGT
jgi:hypothetical protein